MNEMNTLTISLPPSVTPEEATYLLAVKLYETQHISLGKAAELVGCTKRDFMERLVDEGVPVIDYDPDDLRLGVDA
jgi:predicted HTH domain antitoxin